MKVIVDVQGFKTDQNDFIPKEIAVIYKDQVQVLLIKPPFHYDHLTNTEKKQVSWIERNRKILWGEGIVPYDNFKIYFKTFFRNNDVYCKGLEKILWLKQMFGNSNVYNLEDYGCPNLLTLYKLYDSSSDIYSCIYHPTICALKNVTCMKKWCMLNNKSLLI